MCQRTPTSVGCIVPFVGEQSSLFAHLQPCYERKASQYLKHPATASIYCKSGISWFGWSSHPCHPVRVFAVIFVPNSDVRYLYVVRFIQTIMYISVLIESMSREAQACLPLKRRNFIWLLTWSQLVKDAIRYQKTKLTNI